MGDQDSVRGIRLEPVGKSLWLRYRDQVAAIEERIYEPARRDSIEALEAAVLSEGAVSAFAIAGVDLAGFCLGARLERFPHVNGTRSDPGWGRRDTLYVLDTTVVPVHRGMGVARALKTLQLQVARSLGYRFISGRNRVGQAEAMWQLNRRLGAEALLRLENEYPDDLVPNDCIYYRIAIQG